MQYIQSQGVAFPKAQAWDTAMAELNPRSQIFVRYVGCTKGAAFSRHMYDIASIPSVSASHLWQTMRLLFPQLADEVRIYQFSRGTVPVSIRGPNEVRDIKEQAAIALLGPETLLNQEPGGLEPETDQGEEVDQQLAILKLSTTRDLSHQTEPCSASVQQYLAK